MKTWNAQQPVTRTRVLVWTRPRNKRLEHLRRQAQRFDRHLEHQERRRQELRDQGVSHDQQGYYIRRAAEAEAVLS